MTHDVELVECSTASEFLTALSPRGDFFSRAKPHAWIFRGHASDKWDLVPSAFRPSPTFAKFDPSSYWSGKNAEQIWREAATLKLFVEEADGSGLAISHDLDGLRKQLHHPLQVGENKAKYATGELEWPPRIAWPVVALAQHYGLATRFLDWTYSSFVAAYFAAIDSVAPAASGNRLCVWAFSVVERFLCWSDLNTFDRMPERFPEEIRVPYAGNPNLRAQEGLHIAVGTKLDFEAPVERLDFLPYLRIVDDYSRKHSGRALVKFTLPTDEGPILLWHLAKERITPARLFPGYAGAARSVLEYALRRAPSAP